MGGLRKDRKAWWLRLETTVPGEAEAAGEGKPGQLLSKQRNKKLKIKTKNPNNDNNAP